MKKLVILIIIISFIAGCGQAPKTSTASYIKVLEKNFTGKKFWIRVVDPNSHQKKEFKITINNENLWNLIEENKEYFADYVYVSLDKEVDLEMIKQPARPK